MLIKDQVDEVVECDDGSKALKHYVEHHPDFVLMDIKMKEVDGFTATRKIIDAFPAAKVIIISQWDDRTLRENARQAGASAYINKDDLRPLRNLLVSDM